jgi:hypothetical protein
VSDVIKTIKKADKKEVRAKKQPEMLTKLAHKGVEPSVRLDTFVGQLKQMFLDKTRNKSISWIYL